MQLRGELFKAGENGTGYKLRWFELLGRELRWSEVDGGLSRGSVDLREARVLLDLYERRTDEDRYGFRLVPRSGSRSYALQASSQEERRVWVDAIEAVAQPDVSSTSLTGACREVLLKKPPATQPIGIDLGSQSGIPCVIVLRVDGKAAVDSGLLAGDIILQMGNTVLRTAALALRMFRQSTPGDTLSLRLATWNRSVRVVKREGKLGILCSAAPSGPGVIVSSVVAGGGAEASGVHVGDRVIGIDGELAPSTHDDFVNKIKESSSPDVTLVLSGFTTSHVLRKDTQGMLGLKCLLGGTGGMSFSPHGAQGGLISEVLPRSSARDAGLRAGDLIISVEGHLVASGEDAIHYISACARSVNIVVWRGKPDVTDVTTPLQLPAQAAANAKGGASGSGAAARQWYYTAEVRDSMPVPQVAYEDLTLG